MAFTGDDFGVALRGMSQRTYYSIYLWPAATAIVLNTSSKYKQLSAPHAFPKNVYERQAAGLRHLVYSTSEYELPVSTATFV